jgi:hypothetical protein
LLESEEGKGTFYKQELKNNYEKFKLIKMPIKNGNIFKKKSDPEESFSFSFW